MWVQPHCAPDLIRAKRHQLCHPPPSDGVSWESRQLHLLREQFGPAGKICARLDLALGDIKTQDLSLNPSPMGSEEGVVPAIALM